MIICPSVPVAIWSFTSRLVVYQGCLFAPTTSEVQRTNEEIEHQAENPTSGTLIPTHTDFTIAIMQNPAQGIAPDLVNTPNIPCHIWKPIRTILTAQLASPCALYLHLPLSYHANCSSTQDCGMALGSSKARIEPLTILLELPRPSDRWHDYADMAAFSTAW